MSRKRSNNKASYSTSLSSSDTLRGASNLNWASIEAIFSMLRAAIISVSSLFLTLLTEPTNMNHKVGYTWIMKQERLETNKRVWVRGKSRENRDERFCRLEGNRVLMIFARESTKKKWTQPSTTTIITDN